MNASDWRHRRKKGVKELKCFNPGTLAGWLPLAEMLRFRAALQPLKANARPHAHTARLYVDISHHRVCFICGGDTGVSAVSREPCLPPHSRNRGAPGNHFAS